jgi:hypothetical protein
MTSAKSLLKKIKIILKCQKIDCVLTLETHSKNTEQNKKHQIKCEAMAGALLKN